MVEVSLQTADLMIVIVALALGAKAVEEEHDLFVGQQLLLQDGHGGADELDIVLLRALAEVTRTAVHQLSRHQHFVYVFVEEFDSLGVLVRLVLKIVFWAQLGLYDLLLELLRQPKITQAVKALRFEGNGALETAAGGPSVLLSAASFLERIAVSVGVMVVFAVAVPMPVIVFRNVCMGI
jgi:hypothetical protein